MHKLPVCHTCVHGQTHWSLQSAVTGLSLVGWYCPVPPDPLSASPSGWGPGSVATGPWGSSAHRLTQPSGTPAGPLSSWHRTVVGMAPPLGRYEVGNDTKTDRERQRNVQNIKFPDRLQTARASLRVRPVEMSSRTFWGASTVQSHVNPEDPWLQCAQEEHNEWWVMSRVCVWPPLLRSGQCWLLWLDPWHEK